MMATTPDPLPPLIGREVESAQIQDALTRQGVRLLVLTGPGGVGKTRLAREVTAQLAPRFESGVAVVPVGDIHDPALVLPAIARAIGLPNDGSSPVTERLHARLAAAKLLLALDNLEHVPSVAPSLVRLLDGCPGVRILVANRLPLGVAGEVVMPVPPLSVPDPSTPPSLAALAEHAAVRLLAQEAQGIDPSMALREEHGVDIAEICSLLDGMPLAIELAAARLRQYSLAALRKQLARAMRHSDDVPGPVDRDQTMRAVIAWSYGLLTPEEQGVLRCLAVLEGHFGVEAVLAVCGDHPDDQRPAGVMPRGMAALHDAGLVRSTMIAGEPRFFMPEMVREDALSRLELAGEAETSRRRHARYFLALAERAAPALRGPDQKMWSARLETEDHNLRAAIRWALVHEPDTALRLVAALWRYWYMRGRLREGERWIERALATASEASVARVRALNGLGLIVWTMGNRERALALLNASLDLAREIADPLGVATALRDRGILEFRMSGDGDRAREAVGTALAQFRALGDRHSEALALCTLGSIDLSEGNLAAAAQFRDALALAEEIGDFRTQVITLRRLAQMARTRGERKLAMARFQEALLLSHQLGNQEDLLHCLAGIGGVAVDARQFEHATRLLASAKAIADALGVGLQPLEQAQLDQDIARAGTHLPDADFSQAWMAGRSCSVDAAVAEGLRMAPSVRRHLANSHGLTRREIEVLRLMAEGRSDREIADALFIGYETATSHSRNIRRKLSVHTRTEATAFAIRHGLV